MIWVAIFGILIVFPVILLIFFRGRKSQGPSKPQKQVMLYAPGSEDVAGGAYHSARKTGAMPFPMGKKKERKKTETFQRHSDDD
ncbi:MAG: hypothetical protein ACXABM_11400 [Candidatus Thorarchaeota archaeon]|jgi:hypothetical protein